MALAFASCDRAPQSGHVQDEAMQAGRTAASFPAADEDYFHDMDGGVALTPGEIKGRNTWIVWSGGDDRLWDIVSKQSFGGLDFLKTVSSHPVLKFSRDTRWRYFGLVDDPSCQKATAPDPSRFNLWLDMRKPECGPDPFENQAKYTGLEGTLATVLPQIFGADGIEIGPIPNGHASCTCAIGPQAAGGVLTSDFKVHGTTGLRVVDASVFPRIPGFFIVTAIDMIAEKAADAILREAA